MLKKYRFEVYSKKMDHKVILSQIADTKSQAIKIIQKKIFELDMISPSIKDFTLLDTNKNLIDFNKRYQTTEGDPVILYKYNPKTKNYSGTIFKEKEDRGRFGTVKKENCFYDRFGEYYGRYEHKNNLEEV